MKGFCSKVSRRLRALARPRSLPDALLYFHILLFVAVTPLLLRLNLRRLHSLLTLLETGGSGRVPSTEELHKITSYVDSAFTAGFPLVRRSCLQRGLTLYHFLRMHGLDVRLCFGVGSRREEFAAHCWLVKDGEPFLEKKDPRPVFKEIYRMHGGAARAD